MEKLEMVHELQEVIEQLYQEMDSFEINIKEVLSLITAKRLLSDAVLKKAWEQLGVIRELGKKCREGYCQLEMSEEAPEYIEQMRMTLTATERLLKEREEYFLAKEEFLRLYSDKAEVEKPLLVCQQELVGYAIERMTEEEVKFYLGKYVLFMKAWREKEALKLIDYVQKLLEFFTKELAAAAVFQKEELVLKERDKEEKREEIDFKEKQTFEQVKLETAEDIAEKETEKFEEAENHEYKKVESDVVEQQERPEEICQNSAVQEEIQVVAAQEIVLREERKEKKNYRVEVKSCAKKEKKKFGVKSFRSDMAGLTEGLRKRILRGIRQYGGITTELLAAMTKRPQEEIAQECDILFNYGYLRKYKVEEMGELYSVSPKGKKSFEVWEALTFLRINSKVSEWESIEDAEDMGSAAAVRLMLLKILAKEFQNRAFPDIQVEHQIKKNVFFLKCRNFDQVEWRYYTGASEWVEDEETYIKDLKEFVENTEDIESVGEIEESKEKETEKLENSEKLTMKWTVLGETDCGERLREWIVRTYKEEVDPQEILLKQYKDEIFIENEEEPAEKEAAVTTESTEDEVLKKTSYIKKVLEESKKGSIKRQKAKETAKKEKTISKISKKEAAEKENSFEDKTKEISSVQSFSEETEKRSKEEWKTLILKNYQDMIEKDKIYCATAYLFAAAQQDKEFLPLYYKLAYAVNDPFINCSYSSGRIFDIYFDDDDSSLSEYYMVSALLRNYFMDHTGYDYQMQQLYDGVKERRIIAEDRCLGEIIYGLLEFKENAHSGIDRFADYKRKDTVAWEAKVAEKKNEAKGYYENYVLGKMAEQASHRRFVETKKLIFSQESDFAFYLKVVSEDSRECLTEAKEYLQTYFIKDGASVTAVNLEAEKMNRFLDGKWDEAGQHLRIAKKSSDLMSSLRMNLYNQIKKALSCICDWIELLENKVIDEKEKGFELYKKVRDVLIGNMQQVIQHILTEEKSLDWAGKKVILFTLTELKARLTGTYQPNLEKYFYIRFLANDKVLLDSEYRPDAEMEVSALPEFAFLRRIECHAQEEEKPFDIQMKEILNGEDDYGSALLLEQYFAECREGQKEDYNIAESILYAEKAAKMKQEEFVENLELAQSYGQMGNSSENKKEKILRAVNECYAYACETKNFGYFSKVLLAFQQKIKEEAKYRESSILKEMETYLDSHGEILEEEGKVKRVEKIRKMIQVQNYTVAEDLLNRLINQEEESELELLKTDYLKDFLHNYDYNYANVSDTGKKLHTLLMTTRAQKEIKGGRKLLEAWLSNGGSLGEQKLFTLLTMLGFPVEQVKNMQKLSNKIENYFITLKRPENGRKLNYKHPIAAFGSTAMEEGFRVVCLYGKYDATSLIDTFKEIGFAKHTIVLLDYPLSDSERRKLARKTKLEVSEKIFGVIDRVLLVYLVNNYTETAINRMLMAVMMPYTYYQPYVVESANPMPPEIFIGRKEELSKIESPSGVNIVYGGRQLGKSALLRMARNDIDRNENGDRAVLVNIKDLDDTKTALKISQTLADEGIFEKDFETDDWDKLARELKKRLQSQEKEKIPYLLLLLDEADAFIESCEAINYHPFDALKDVQEIGTERFKFVVAGLHNIIRFKRNSALGNNSVLTQMESLTVTPFNVMEAKELLQIPLFYLGLRFPEEKDSLVSMILAATNYFPGLLQLYCAKLLEAMKRDYAGYNEKSTPPYEVQENHIKKVLAEEGFQQKIREKFMVTLKLDEDNVYYIIALLTAYMNYKERNQNGYSPKDILRYAKGFEVKKMKGMQPEQVEALMEEMRELNVLRLTSENRYWFTRNNFFQMMGTVDQIEEEVIKYMEQ